MTDERFESLLRELLWYYYFANYRVSLDLLHIFKKCGFENELNDFVNEVSIPF